MLCGKMSCLDASGSMCTSGKSLRDAPSPCDNSGNMGWDARALCEESGRMFCGTISWCDDPGNKGWTDWDKSGAVSCEVTSRCEEPGTATNGTNLIRVKPVSVSLEPVCAWDNPDTCSGDISLRWRHNGRDCVSNHQPHDYLLNRIFRRRSKKTSTLRVTNLCAGNSPGTGEFPVKIASNA